MKAAFFLLVQMTLVCAGSAEESNSVNDRGRRHQKSILLSQISLDRKGNCILFDVTFPKPYCKFLLGHHYQTLLDYSVYNSVAPKDVQLYEDGGCVVEGDIAMVLEQCREHIGYRKYDRLYRKLYGLPNVEIDEQGYCQAGDLELPPDECKSMIGDAPYVVLRSLSTNYA